MDILRRLRYLNSIRPALRTISTDRVVPAQKVHGRLLEFDPTVKTTGLYHLQKKLSPMEAKTLYDQARTHGKAYFQDNRNQNFTLVYGEGAYRLMKRDHESG